MWAWLLPTTLLPKPSGPSGMPRDSETSRSLCKSQIKSCLTYLIIGTRILPTTCQLQKTIGPLPLDTGTGPALSLKVSIEFIVNNEIENVPAPTTYQQRSDFDRSQPFASAFSFGIARDAYAKVYIKENPPTDKSIPGPGAYQVRPKFANEASKYSLYGRNANHSN